MAAREIQRVLKVGNALAVVLPRDIIRALGIQRGARVAVFCTSETEVRIKLVPDEQLQAMRVGIID